MKANGFKYDKKAQSFTFVNRVTRRTVTVKLGETYTHDHYGKSKVTGFDEKHGEPIALIDTPAGSMWCELGDLAF